jgi:hypothetical protein
MADTNYRCPCCRKVCPDTQDLARHYLGQTDIKHKEWLKTKGLSYAQLLTWQVTEFGNRGYDALAEVLEVEAPRV